MDDLIQLFNIPYVNGVNVLKPNSYEVFVNALLVSCKYRKGFLLQRVNYKDIRYYNYLLQKLHDNPYIKSVELQQGAYFYNPDKMSKHKIDYLIANQEDDKILGKALNYPCAGDLLAFKKFKKNNYKHIGYNVHLSTLCGNSVMTNICKDYDRVKKFIVYANKIKNFIAYKTENRIILQITVTETF